MNVYGYHTANVRPISSVYSLDKDVSIKSINDYTKEGLGVNFTRALSTAEDVTTNNFNVMYLTDSRTIDNILEIQPALSLYPKFITTYLKVSGTDLFWVVQESTGITTVTGTSAHIANPYFFELQLLNPLHLVVRHYDGSTLRYLTCNNSTSANLTFMSRATADFVDSNTQIFQYSLDKTNNTVTLFHKLSTALPNPAGQFNPSIITTHSGEHGQGDRLSAVSVGTSNVLQTSGTVFDMRPVTDIPVSFDLRHTWNSYASAINENHLNVNSDKSVKDIKNNYLIHASTNSLGFSSREVGVNMLPLKNQLTMEGSVSRNNPYSNTEDEVNHRAYHKLHTGTFQDHGNESIYMSLASGLKEIKFLSDELTYFHIPQIISPYEQLNINDSSLVKAGAVAADVPIKADKVFKRRSNDHSINEWIPRDELNGTWLCSWLSGAPDPNISPVWVDRFFNPAFETKTTALTSGLLHPVLYINKFESVTRKLGASAQDVTVYDKKSDLTFESGALYAYHHVGRGNSQKVISALDSHLIAKDLKTYQNKFYVNQTVDLATDEPTHTMPNGGTVMTGRTHNNRSVDVPKTYTFHGDRHGIMDTVKHSGSFTFSFWLYSSDWTAPFADQIIGNYVTKGFGVFNEPFVTPFIAIPDGDKIHIYNTDYKYIHTHFINKTISLFTKRGSSENYWIVDPSNDIYEYNINGVIQNKITSSLLTGKRLVDIEVTENSLYLLVDPVASAACQYFSYDLTNQTSGYTGVMKDATVWNHGVGAASLSAARIHAVKRGLSATAGVVVTINDAVSGDGGNALVHPVTGTVVIGNGSVVDNSGNPWTIQNNNIYTYDPYVSSNIKGISAVGMVDGVNCDRDGNIWVLHDLNKVSKLKSNRIKVFTTALTGVLPVSSIHYNRYLDFVHEFTATGYESHATILNQSVSGAKSVKINMDGKVTSDVTLLTGDHVDYVVSFFNTPYLSGWKTTTGFDYLRKNKNVIDPRIEARLAVSNLYNSSTTTTTYSAYTLTYCTSGMSRGWHHFSVLFDAERGRYEMIVDATRVSHATIPPAKFSYSDIFEQPITVGASPFYTKLLLSEHLQQDTSHRAHGVKVSDIKLYDMALNYFDLKAHYVVQQDTVDMKWDIPSGQRNYIDTIERVFRHKLPGRKSETFNVNIKNTTITDPALKTAIENEILDQLNGVIPAYTQINRLGWDGIPLSAEPMKPTIIYEQSPGITTREGGSIHGSYGH